MQSTGGRSGSSSTRVLQFLRGTRALVKGANPAPRQTIHEQQVGPKISQFNGPRVQVMRNTRPRPRSEMIHLWFPRLPNSNHLERRPGLWSTIRVGNCQALWTPRLHGTRQFFPCQLLWGLQLGRLPSPQNPFPPAQCITSQEPVREGAAGRSQPGRCEG